MSDGKREKATLRKRRLASMLEASQKVDGQASVIAPERIVERCLG